MEPNSIVLVVVLLLLAAAAVYGAVRLPRWPVKVVGGVLAIALAVVGGIAIVNDYYGYYQTWTELSSDFTNNYTHFAPAPKSDEARTDSGHVGEGTVEQVQLRGRISHIDRSGYVYLPPQYFEKQYANVRFPVVELLHGSPGTPANWIVQINLPAIMNRLIAQRLTGPMIVVMPSIDPAHGFQDCTNAPGALDGTYISQDVPDDIRARFRATDVPSEWAIGGYSSGGYCAANLTTQHPAAYGAAGIMDGYFRAVDGPAAGALHDNARAEAANDPLTAAQRLTTSSHPLPSYWISAGTTEAKYFLGAKAFVKALQGLIAVDFTIEPGAGHNFYAWRAATPRMLAWMWTQIAPPSLRVQFPIAGPVRRFSVAPSSVAPSAGTHSSGNSAPSGTASTTRTAVRKRSAHTS